MTTRVILSILLALSLVLLIRIVLYVSQIEPYEDGRYITFQTKVEQQPRISLDGQRLTARLPNSQRATFTLPLTSLLNYGDIIKLEGRLKYVDLKDGARILVLEDPSFSLINQGASSSLLLKVRDRVISFFHSNLGTREASLVLGIVFGIKDEMPKEFEEKLRVVGLTHIVVASGMNITMVGGLLVAIFSYFFRRQTALVLSIGGICFYALLAGAEPSIVRASIMGVLVFVAQIIGRQSTSYAGLFFAAFLMLFTNPSLLFDIGFQLSFLATFGLVFLNPALLLSRKLKEAVEKSVIGQDLLTTLTAQLFTLPILLMNFGSYSLLSILVNTLVLWTIPLIMIVGGIATIVGLAVSPLGQLVSYLVLPLLFYLEKVVEAFSSFKLEISITSLPLSLIAGYYLLLLSFGFWLNKKK